MVKVFGGGAQLLAIFLLVIAKEIALRQVKIFKFKFIDLFNSFHVNILLSVADDLTLKIPFIVSLASLFDILCSICLKYNFCKNASHPDDVLLIFYAE